MNKDKKKQSKLFVIYGIIVTIIIGIFAISPFKISNIMTNSKKVNAAGDIPAHEKTRTSNNDGTYKISLSVTGDVTKKPNKANVIVILDSSGSMNNRTGGTGSIRRLEAAKNAVNSLANNLLAYNSKEGYPADTIQMALVDFNNHANQVGNITTSASTFNGYVNGLTSGGGTNWEAALSTANSISFGDDDQTYVIFVSDGNPTFRDTQNGWNDWSGGEYQAWGSGQETSQNITRCYTTALPKAQEIVTAGKKFYTIGAYGDVDRMQSLTTEAGAPAGNYYSAANTSALEAALESIMNEISQSGIANAEIVDGTTNKVASSTEIFELLEVDTTSFKYYKNGVEWTSEEDPAPPAATLDPATGKVTWDLKSIGLLENEVKYEVTFDVYPSQYTYDLIADLKNETKQYNSLPSVIKEYLHDLGNGNYSLETNTVATLSYDDTRTEDEEQPVRYDNPPAVATTADTITIEKEWDNTLDSRQKEAVEVNLQRDGVDFYPANLNEANNWKLNNIYMATGLARLKNGVLTVLDIGHDYKFAELGAASYNWELETETVHPMLINGVLTKLILVEDSASIPSQMSSSNYYKDGNTEYFKLANGKVYKAAGTDAKIKATNHRRSNLNIKKVIEAANEASLDQNQEFTFTINVTQKDEENRPIPDDTTTINDDLWFNIRDNNNQDVTLDEEPTGWQKDPNSTYYHAPNGTQLVVKLKNGYNMRFTNLLSNTDFTIVEENLDKYTLSKIESNDDKNESDIATRTLNGQIKNDNTSYQVTYTNVYQKVNIPVEKKWKDDINDGVQPKEITVDLYANGEKVENQTATIKASEDWKYTWKDLDRYSNGEEINYTIKEINENISNHYTTTYEGNYKNGFTITNTRRPDDLSVEVKAKKVWDDKENQDDIRPSSVTFEINDEDKTQIILDGTADQDGQGEYNAWEATFKNLPKYKNGVEIEYQVEEVKTNVLTGTDGPTTYSITKTGDYKSLITITNKHTPQVTEVTVTKVWNDKNDQDGYRPDDINVILLANGKEAGTATLSEDNDWAHTFENLDKKANGKDIEYTIKEVEVDEYQSAISGDQATGYTITNTHETEQTEVKVTKVWNDKDDQDGYRPDNINVILLADGKEADKATLSEDNDWTHTFDKLDKKANGKDIEYTVQEVEVDKYQSAISGDQKAGYTITNTHETEQTEVKVTKVWDDNDDQDGFRPNNINVILLANGKEAGNATLSEANDWTHTFDKLDKKANGKDIEYTVQEVKVDEYQSSISGDQATGYTITNTHETEQTQVKVTKVWDDNDDQDGKRPSDISVVLLANEEPVGNATLSERNYWAYTFIDLDKYENGQEIAYTVQEVKVNGYQSAITGNKASGYTITNTHEPELVDKEITKTWDDNRNKDGKRPAEITIHLLANGEVVATEKISGTGDEWKYTFHNLPKYANGEEITYTVTEEAVAGYDKTENGLTITNKHTILKTSVCIKKEWEDKDDQDGYRPTSIFVNLFANDTFVMKQEVKVNEDNKWEYTFENLDQYANGKEIEYTVTEDEVKEYTSSISGDQKAGYTITNTHETEQTEVKVTKVWDDNDDQDGFRPNNINVILLANGKEAGNATLSEANDWTHTFDKLDKKANGKDIEYTVQEVKVDEYQSSISGDQATGYTITNTHETEQTQVKVTKVWDDNDDQDGKRPSDISVVLLANEEPVGNATLSERNYWAYTFIDLDKYENGQEIAYTVQEVKVNGYQSAITGNKASGYTITNTHEPELVDKEITKTWDDNRNKDGKRPAEITIHLLANGEVVATEKISGTGDEWKYTFHNLPKYANGEEITYTVTEEAVAGYDKTENGLTITNKHTILKTSVCIKKEWEDKDDQDGYRPTSIFVNLFANDTFVKKQEVTVNEDNKWEYTFEDLDQYADGSEIVYTITEDEVKEYTSAISGDQETGYTITNTHKTEQTEVKVTKVWDDNDNQDGFRPNNINVILLANGKEAGNATLSEANDWTHTFDKLDKKANGKDIEYTVQEVKVDKYTSAITGDQATGYTITNTHTPEKTEVPVIKTWDEEKNIYGFEKPETITVHLFADGTEIASHQISSEENWQYTFTGLDKFKDQKEISYTIKEDSIRDYDTDIVNYNIKNTYNPETKDLKGTKTWKDNTDQDGARPTEITVTLIGKINKDTENEKIVYTEEKVVSGSNEEDEWYYTFTNMPVYYNNQLIDWTVKENTVDGYDTEESQLDVINTYYPEKVSFTVTKEWDDADDNDHKRPTSIVVRLYANGEEIDSIEISESNNWTYSFTELPKFYNHGEPIEYTIDEDPVEEYEKEIEYSNEYEANITNTHPKRTVSINIEKIWNDNDDEFGFRPDSIIVDIYRNNELFETVTLTAEEGWKITLSGLDEFINGEPYVYTIKERPVDQYTTSYDNYKIMNKVIEPEEEIEIIPPDTGLMGQENTNYIYLILAILSTLSLGFYKVFE